MNDRERAIKLLDNIKNTNAALYEILEHRDLLVKSLMLVLETRISEADGFIANETTPEYWEGVRDQAQGTLNFIKNSFAV